MLCKKPYSKGVMNFSCGQCMPCRVNRTRLWVGRMMLESMCHPFNSFVTLTYNEENLPVGLVKEDVQGFLKRLRAAIYPRRIRYYAVGELGEENGRPHYHLIVFGLSPTESEVVKACWPVGFSFVGTVSSASLSYTLGYVVKGKLKPGVGFALMFRRPGIGLGFEEGVKNYINALCEAYKTTPGKAALHKDKWIQGMFRIQGKLYPLGRYLKGRLYAAMGIDKDDVESYNARVEFETWVKTPVSFGERSRLRDSVLQAQEGKINRYGEGRRKL